MIRGCVLLPRNARVGEHSGKTPGWNVMYADEVSMVFVKSRSVESNGNVAARLEVH